MPPQELINAYRYHRQIGDSWLEHRAKGCLVLARKDVAAGRKRYPADRPYSPGTWQKPERDNGLDGGYFFRLEILPEGFVRVAPAHELVRLSDGHTGWYTRNEPAGSDDLLIGVVVRMRGPDGKRVLVPGYEEGSGNGVCIWPGERFELSEERDCAYRADRHAEIVAGHECDYNDAWQAGTRAADYRDEANSVRSDLVAFLASARKAKRELANHCDLEVVVMMLRDHVRERVEELMEEITQQRGKRDALRDAYFSRLIDAFNEGYGV